MKSAPCSTGSNSGRKQNYIRALFAHTLDGACRIACSENLVAFRVKKSSDLFGVLGQHADKRTPGFPTIAAVAADLATLLIRAHRIAQKSSQQTHRLISRRSASACGAPTEDASDDAPAVVATCELALTCTASPEVAEGGCALMMFPHFPQRIVKA
jgi:hypothetical protein